MTKRFQHEGAFKIQQNFNFNMRVHLKYNKILIGDDQTNNDEISETVLFPFSFFFFNITKC